MKEEIKGAKELINIPEIKNGNYSFIGDSNITYADIRNLIDYIKQLETNWKELKEWLAKSINMDIDNFGAIESTMQNVLNVMQELEDKNEN